MAEAAPLPLDGPFEGRSLLVAGPPMTGKYELMLRIIAAGAQRAIIIATGDRATDVRRDFTTMAGVGDDAVGVVDCVTRQQEATARDEPGIRYAASPQNVTEIGMKFTDLFEEFREEPETVGVGLHSLSEMLMYLDAQDVYQFVRVLTKQAESEDWFTVAVIGSTMHDEQTLHTLYEPFDTVVDTRESDSGTGRELRIREGNKATTAWTPF